MLHKFAYNKESESNLIYKDLLEQEKVESLSALEFCGWICGMKNKKGLMK